MKTKQSNIHNFIVNLFKKFCKHSMKNQKINKDLKEVHAFLNFKKIYYTL